MTHGSKVDKIAVVEDSLDVLGVFDGVSALLQLGDVQLGLAAIQALEPHLIMVNGGYYGTRIKKEFR